MLLNYSNRVLINYIISLVLLSSGTIGFLSSMAILSNRILGTALLLLCLITKFKYGFLSIISLQKSLLVQRAIAIAVLVFPFILIEDLKIMDIAFYISLVAIFIFLELITDHSSYRYPFKTT